MYRRLSLCLLLSSSFLAAQTYTYSNLIILPPYKNGPVGARGGLISDSLGNLYGATTGGGAHAKGTIFKVSLAGTMSTVFSFSGGKNGSVPVTGVARDSAGNFYGMANSGGSANAGVIFKVTADGKESVLFNLPSGTYQYFPVTLDTAANIYGFTYSSAQPSGSIVKITPKGVASTLYVFCSQANCADGSLPTGSLILDKAGNIYGTTSTGGEFGFGAVFQITPQNKYFVLYSFTGIPDSGNPIGKLTQTPSGMMYGAASGTQSGTNGEIFTISSAGAFSSFYTFTGGSDGYDPVGPLLIDSLGNLYGVTINNSSFDAGAVVFQITPGGTETSIYVAGPAGSIPGIAMDKSGNIYGETPNGGPKHLGTIYKLTKN